MLASLNARLDVTLPDGEAIALAMHLVNAGFATGDLSYTYTMTGVIQQLLDIIDHSYGITLDRSSVNVAGSSPICVTCSYASTSTSN